MLPALAFIILGNNIRFAAMSYTIGIACSLIAIVAYGVFLYVRRKRIERIDCSDLDIPAFLRRDYTPDNRIDGSDAYPSTSVHPWGSRK